MTAPSRTAVKHQVNGLTVTEWPGRGPVVFCLPGLGSSAAMWGALAEDLPDARVLSFDMRGRGDGQGMTGPTGLTAHAKDVAAILEALDLTDVVLLGHSMGGYLAPVVALHAPDRVRKLVCVDGGVRPAFPFFMRPTLVRLTFKRQLSSMDKVWPDIEAVAKKGAIGKMVASFPELRPRVLAMLESEMAKTGGGLKPRVDVDRTADDAIDCFFGPDQTRALEQLAVPMELILAENAKFDGNKPFISDAQVAVWTARNPLITVQRLKGNHMTVVFAPEVRAAVTS